MTDAHNPSTDGIRYQQGDDGPEIDFRTLTLEAWSSGGGHAYGRLPQGGGPHPRTLVLRGLPEGTKCISVWMSESKADRPHAVGVRINTSSVFFYANGTKTRVRFHHQWGEHTPVALHVLYR